MNVNAELPLTRKENHERLLRKLRALVSGEFMHFDKSEIERSIPSRFERIASRFPFRLAVRTLRGDVTYRELNQAANCIARMILARRGRGPEPIGLLLENDWPMIAAMLGTLKAGKFYVPLDASLPKARLKYILEDSQARLIVADTANASLAGDLACDEVAWIDGQNLGRNLGAENLGLPILAHDYAWILYTSGSTGHPKGVVQNHRNVLHYVKTYTDGLCLSPSDRSLLIFPFAVNAASHEIFSSLLNGASLHPFDIKRRELSNLARWIADQKLTIYSSVPTVFRNFCELLSEQEMFSDTRLVKLVGEPVLRRDVNLYRKHFSSACVFVNRLGSTETGSIRWLFLDKRTPIEENAVPVGFPTPDNDVALLNERGEKVPMGEIGEICVESRYLSPGYWRNPEATQSAFQRKPKTSEKRNYRTGDLGLVLSDGCLAHLGRMDFQIKIGGHRIETGEIETALSNVAGVKEVVVVAKKDPRGQERLVAYLLVHEPATFQVDKLRIILAETLPGYMIPSVFQIVQSFPLAANGKIIRRNLPSPDWTRPDLKVGFVAPRTPIERALAEIWMEVLALDKVGIKDDFFELGGNSLSAIQVVSRVFRKFELELPVKSLFQSPSVGEMAAVVTQRQGSKLSKKELVRVLAELECLSEEEAQKAIVCEVRKDRGVKTM